MIKKLVSSSILIIMMIVLLHFGIFVDNSKWNIEGKRFVSINTGQLIWMFSFSVHMSLTMNITTTELG